jgi:hypothetical protein
MTRLKWLAAGLALLLAAFAQREAVAAPIRVASPEGVFLDVARQIGGPEVVVEIVKPPGRPAERPQILVTEGDAEDRLEAGERARIGAGAVVTARAFAPASIGAGPTWYDLSAMGAVGKALATALERAAPGDASGIEARRDDFLRALAELKLKSKQIVDGYGGTSVLLTDGRFAPFCRSLGFSVVAIPPRADEAAKSAIASRKGIVLVYNAEAPGGLGPLKTLAEDAGLPLVGLRMTLPPGLSYQQWIGREINLIRGALNEAAP